MKASSPLGVLLVNLGTPDEPTKQSIRRYLREFLLDPRVVNVPKAIWCPILFWIILPLRPKRLVPDYESIWGEDGAPIRVYSESLARKVEAELAKQQLKRKIRVVSAMTYGNPSIADTLAALKAEGIEDIMVIPTFPQYAGATVAAVYDKLAKVLKKSPVLGEIRFVNEYYDSIHYIHALTKQLEDFAHRLDGGARMIFSFHGIPEAQASKGDPYPEQCRETAEKIAHNLGLADDQWMMTYQSRFGPAPWLQPYTDKTLEALPKDGTKQVIITCPGFATDCLETLFEIDVENRHIFMEAGGESFTYVPALNDSEEHVDVMRELILSRLYPSEIR